MGAKTTGQKIFVAVVIAINLILWLIPSDVVELVARDRHTLLGRYSRTHFAWIFGMIPLSIILNYLHLSPNWAVKKKRIFKTILALLAGFVPLLGADIYLRATKQWRYVLGKQVYHRTPGLAESGTHFDRPKAARTYPNAPSGYPDLPWTFHADDHGFRNPNPNAEDQYDIVVLGDSFVEGSGISDDQRWVVQFEEQIGKPVYSLGMSGYAPQHYTASLLEHGLQLQPKWVVCMFYEGNDFRTAKLKIKNHSKWGRFFKRSPLVQAFDELLINALGPIGAKRQMPALDVLSWMPVRVATDAGESSYAFAPSDLLRLCMPNEEFKQHKYWRRTSRVLGHLRHTCESKNVNLLLVFAPAKPHVVLPIATNPIPAEQLHAFAALRAKDPLPASEEFKKLVMENLSVGEQLMRAWAEENEVPFISLTEPLRQSISNGNQAYFTYDEHWAPPGHQTAANTIASYWKSLTTPATED